MSPVNGFVILSYKMYWQHGGGGQNDCQGAVLTSSPPYPWRSITSARFTNPLANVCQLSGVPSSQRFCFKLFSGNVCVCLPFMLSCWVIKSLHLTVPRPPGRQPTTLQHCTAAAQFVIINQRNWKGQHDLLDTNKPSLRFPADNVLIYNYIGFLFESFPKPGTPKWKQSRARDPPTSNVWSLK